MRPFSPSRAASLVAACLGLAACSPDQDAPDRAEQAVQAPEARGGGCLPPEGNLVLEGTATQSSTVAFGRGGGQSLAFIADEDERALRVVDVDAGVEIATEPLAGAPSAVLASHTGRVYVALADASALEVFDVTPEARLVRRCEVPTPAEPTSLALLGQRLFVVSRWGRALTSFDGTDLVRQGEVTLPRDPYAVAVSGGQVFVSHLVGGRVSRIDLDLRFVGKLSLVMREREHPDTDKMGLSFHEPTPPPPIERPAHLGYALVAGDMTRLFMPAVLVHDGQTERSSGYGGGHIEPVEGTVAVIQADREPFLSLPSSRADDCLLPRAAAWDEAHGVVLVACLGVDRVHAYDLRNERSRGLQRYAVSVPAGPTGIAVDGARALVWSQYDRALSMWRLQHVDFERFGVPPRELTLTRRIDLAQRRQLPEAVAVGRRIFHAAGDLRLSRDGRACASCHPGGRDDGVSWQTPEGPRQTPILMARLRGTAPFGWDGTNASALSHLDLTLKRLGGMGLGQREREALFAYIESLAPPPSWRSPPSDSQRVARGAELFSSRGAGCASCHDTDRLTSDGVRHQVGSKGPRDLHAAYDTPSLAFVGQSPPYFHDGRYPTLRALLTDPGGAMAATSTLPREDLAALEAYLDTL